MAFDSPAQEDGSGSGSGSGFGCLDLRPLEACSPAQGLARLQELLAQPQPRPPRALILPLDAEVVDQHPEVVIDVLTKLKGSVEAVTLTHYSVGSPQRQGPRASAQLAVLGAVLQLPLRRLRLFSPHDSCRQGVRVARSFAQRIAPGLAALDLRCSATYFNEAGTKLLRIHRSTLSQVRLPERPSWHMVRALSQCKGVQTLGLPDLRLVGKLGQSLLNVREVLVTSSSGARRRKQRLTHHIIMSSKMLQQVEHISLQGRFWTDITPLSTVCKNLKQLTLHSFSHLYLKNILRPLCQFPSLKVVRLYHCEVLDLFVDELKRTGLCVEVICKRVSSPGVLMTVCSAKDCDTCLENTADMPLEEKKLREKGILDKLREEVDTSEKRCTLQRATMGHYNNTTRNEKKQFRLTSSNFAAVCKRRNSTLCHNLVKKIVFPPSLDYVKAIRWARLRREQAKEKYEEATGNKVTPCGLFVHEDLPFLGASPDYLVDTDGIVKIKYFPFLQTSLKKAQYNHRVLKKLPIDSDLNIKEDHRFHYQIQGQLAICQKSWCDLVLHGPEDQLVIRVWRDEAFWAKMLPLLMQFYMNCLLSEYADSRIRRGLQAREPQFILKALEEEEIKRRERAQNPSNRALYNPFMMYFTNFLIPAHC